MNKQELLDLVEGNFSTREIAVKLSCSQTNVRYWLNKFELKTKKSDSEKQQYMTCVICGKNKHKNLNNKRCQSCDTRIRRFRVKAAGVKYLGGRCNRCGWDNHIVGFDFHHLHNKDFVISMNAASRTWDKIKEELDKCELLCATCHRLEHCNYIDDEKFMKEAYTYNGNLLDFD